MPDNEDLIRFFEERKRRRSFDERLARSAQLLRSMVGTNASFSDLVAAFRKEVNAQLIVRFSTGYRGPFKQ